jgi:1-acyl-sn-glycerol-3-phosphate acyltransferase
MRTLIAISKIFAFMIWSILLVPLQIIILTFHRGKWAYELPYLWERGVCKIFGLRVTTEGAPNKNKQTIYMANHISYLDIPVIASVLKASFVAKADVAKWPVFGFLSKMQQTAFIERSRKDISVQRYALQNMLQEGKSLIIFPEGTSSDGQNVLPFKSSLFSIAFNEDNLREDLYIQPLTLSLSMTNRQEIRSQEDRDLYAWHGDMTLSPHLWQFAKSKGATINITFHPAYKAIQYNDRKTLAKKCYEDVLNGLHQTPVAA